MIDLDAPKSRGNRQKQVSVFQRPFLEGWQRKGNQHIFYQAPNKGRCFHNLNEIGMYLDDTNSRLRIDCFDLSRDVKISTVFPKTRAQAYVSDQHV